MVSSHKKRLSNRRLLGQFDDFDQDVIIGNAMNNRQENTTVNERTANQEFTVGNSDSGPAVNENVVNVETLERCFNKRIDREIGNIVDTDEDRIQSTNLTAIDSIINPKIFWTGCDQCSGKFRTWGTDRDYWLFWKRIGKEQYTTCVKYKWWDSKQSSGRGKWIVGPRYTFWPATTHSTQSPFKNSIKLHHV